MFVVLPALPPAWVDLYSEVVIELFLSSVVFGWHELVTTTIELNCGLLRQNIWRLISAWDWPFGEDPFNVCTGNDGEDEQAPGNSVRLLVGEVHRSSDEPTTWSCFLDVLLLIRHDCWLNCCWARCAWWRLMMMKMRMYRKTMRMSGMKKAITTMHRKRKVRMNSTLQLGVWKPGERERHSIVNNSIVAVRSLTLARNGREVEWKGCHGNEPTDQWHQVNASRSMLRTKNHRTVHGRDKKKSPE